MKIKILLLIACVVSLQDVFAQASCRMNGTWYRQGDDVKLYAIRDGRLEEISQCRPDAQNRISFEFNAGRPGFYVVGLDSPRILPYKYVLYFRPGDVLTVAFCDSTYTVRGGAKKQNDLLKAWQDYIRPLRERLCYIDRYPTTFDDYMHMLIGMAASVPDALCTPTGDKAFDLQLEVLHKSDFLIYGINFNPPRGSDPRGFQYEGFYSHIRVETITEHTDLYRYPYGMMLLKRLRDVYNRTCGRESTGPVSLAQFLPHVINDTLKGDLVLDEAAKLKSMDGFDAFMAEWGRYVLSNDQKTQCAMLRGKLPDTQANTSVKSEFKYENVSGNMVCLSDFAGKYVLVDCWATWCMPCRAEIPYLKTLEEEFAGRDVVFIGVSADVAKDRQKWRDFVTKESLGGVQVLADGFQSDFLKSFDITAIPRFMIFDRQGRVVMPDAPRPSTPELKLILEALLQRP